MTVYFAPKNNYYGGFLGALGQGAAGIVTNLLGSQLAGMMDRAKQARDAKIYAKFLGEMDAMGDTSGLTKEQMMYSTMRNKYYPLLSEDSRNRWQALADERGMNLGLAELSSGMNNLYGRDATNMVTGMKRAGYDPTVQKGLLDIAVPKLETQTHDLGDRVLTYRQDPYKRGIVEGSLMSLDKNATPDAQLTADVQREGYRNALDVARLESGGRIGAAKIAAAAKGGGSAWDLADLVKQREQLMADVSMRDPEKDPEVPRLNYMIATIDNAINSLLPPLPMPGASAQQPQVDKERAIADMVKQGATREEAEAAFNRKYETQ